MAVVAEDGSCGRSGRVQEAGEMYFSCQAKASVDQFWLPESVPMDLVCVPALLTKTFLTYPLGGSPLLAYLFDRGGDDGECVVPPAP